MELPPVPARYCVRYGNRRASAQTRTGGKCGRVAKGRTTRAHGFSSDGQNAKRRAARRMIRRAVSASIHAMGQKRIDAMDLTSELSRFLFSVGLCAVLVIGVKWLGTDRRFARPRAMARRAIALVARLRPHHAIMVA